MKPEDEEATVELLCEIFGWDATHASKYSALRILRNARGEPAPTPDDYRVGRK